MLQSKGLIIMLAFMVFELVANPMVSVVAEGQDSLHDPPKHIARKLKRDAARIAIRMESKGKDISQQNIEIPTQKASLLYKLFVSIYNSKIPEADAVNKCNIHVSADIPVDKFWLVYSKESSWAASLQDGQSEAGGEVGDILDEFDLIITDRKNWDAEHDIITVESTELYNMAALVLKFQAIDGIFEVLTKNSTMDSDQDIVVSSDGERWLVKYVKKWSNFKDSKSHEWTFSVNEESQKVNFINETGDELPNWMACTSN